MSDIGHLSVSSHCKCGRGTMRVNTGSFLDNFQHCVGCELIVTMCTCPRLQSVGNLENQYWIQDDPRKNLARGRLKRLLGEAP